MGKLRHIAITTPDPEATATFYEDTFGMQRVWSREIGVMLTDGIVSMAILRFPTDQMAGDERGKDFFGLHHIGFVVDDKEAAGKRAEELGGEFFMELPDNIPGVDAETKYKDPNGLVFDIADHDWTQSDRKQ